MWQLLFSFFSFLCSSYFQFLFFWIFLFNLFLFLYILFFVSLDEFIKSTGTQLAHNNEFSKNIYKYFHCCTIVCLLFAFAMQIFVIQLNAWLLLKRFGAGLANILVSSYNATKSLHCWHFHVNLYVFTHTQAQADEQFNEHKFKVNSKCIWWCVYRWTFLSFIY